MKKTVSFLAVLAILFSGCKKNEPGIRPPADPIIQAAKNYFERSLSTHGIETNTASSSPSNPRFPSSRTVLWNSAVTMQFPQCKAVIVPVQYAQPFYTGSSTDVGRLYSSNEITKLCIYTDKQQQYHAEQLSFFPDSNYSKNGHFTGLVSIDDWSGNALKKYRIEKSGRISKWNGVVSSDTLSRVAENSVQENMLSVIESCYEVYGYNYSPAIPGEVFEWSQLAGCTYSVVSDGDDDEGGGTISGSQYSTAGTPAGSGATITPVKTVTIVSGNNIIGNISDYDKCFTNIAGSGNTYKVTVCVDQPVPGSREAWGFSASGAAGSSFGTNPVDVGHTFLIFTQTSGAGSIIRNTGFYPAGSVNPYVPSDQGQLNNDAGHIYDISLTITVTNSQFFNMLAFVSQGNNSGYMYNLNSNNCTSFALHTLSAGDITLPSTVGTWPGGSGNDPGDLGEDIRSMPLSSNMTRSTSEVAHPNLGTCN